MNNIESHGNVRYTEKETSADQATDATKKQRPMTARSGNVVLSDLGQ